MPFAKGKSGNPGGRPKRDRDVTVLAKQHTKVAVETLINIARDKKEAGAARVSASVALLDRGWGRPSQRQEISGAPGGPPVLFKVEK